MGLDFIKVDLIKKNQFEKKLYERASERTITDVLTDISSEMDVGIVPLDRVSRDVLNQEFRKNIEGRILVGYKDGVALRHEKMDPDVATYYYFLHRNNEEMVYVLPNQRVRIKGF